MKKMTPEAIHARRWATLAVLCLSLLLVVVDTAVLAAITAALLGSLAAAVFLPARAGQTAAHTVTAPATQPAPATMIAQPAPAGKQVPPSSASRLSPHDCA
jgi:hypothetical protein